MKVLILAGGYGTRIGDETGLKPKPMIEIGHRPILWHVMKHYHHYGFSDFVILAGYMGHVIKEYFANYYLNESLVRFDFKNNQREILRSNAEEWSVTILDTGLETMTGGRILRAKELIGNEPFLLTYGDGVADVNVAESVEEHQRSGRHLTMTAVRPEGRFGVLEFSEDGELSSFKEKPKGDAGWINGGFFVCSPQVFDYIEDDSTIFERAPLENMARDRQVNVYKHDGFWKCMDTVADKKNLNSLWKNNHAEWKIWQ